MDELARAYAALGVTAGSSVEEIRKRYKALVKKWHPDRYASDPQGQAEAAVRMRAINDAFRSVVGSRVFRRAEAPVSTARPSGGRRLTREEIDRMVEAMRNDGPLDWLLEESPNGTDEKLDRATVAVYVAFATGFTPFLFAGALGLSDGAILFLMAAACVAGFVATLRVLPKE